MDFYKSKMFAGKEIEKIFQTCLNIKEPVKISSIVLNITGRFAVPEKFVRRQLTLLADVYQDKCSISEEEIVFDK